MFYFRCELNSTYWNGTADTYAIQSDEHRSALMQYLKVDPEKSNNTDPFTGICQYKNQSEGEMCDSYVYSDVNLVRTVVTDVCII